MLPEGKSFSAPAATPEGPFPLGPFPRHIWIHSSTPQDELDKACYEIWKRVQRLSEELQLPLLHQVLCPDLSRTLRTDTIASQGCSRSLDEPEGLKSIYSTVIGNREREMKLRALCDAQLSAKPAITSLLYSAKSSQNPRGLEAGSMAGVQSREGSELGVPCPPKDPEPAKGASHPVPDEAPKARKEFLPNRKFSYAKSRTAVPSTAAEAEAAGQKQQLQPFAEICSKPDCNAATKNPVATAAQDKKDVTYNTSTPGFSATTMSTALNQPAYQSLSFPPFPIFPNNSNFLLFQDPYHPGARMLCQPAPHAPLGCYSRQGALYSPWQFFQPPYTPRQQCLAPGQPGYPYQQVTPLTPARTMQDLAMAGNRMQYPFSPGSRFNSRPGGAVATNLNCLSSESCAKF